MRKVGILLSGYFLIGISSILYVYTDAEVRTGSNEYYFLLQVLGIIFITTVFLFIVLQVKNRLTVKSLALWGTAFSLLYIFGISFYISDRPIYKHSDSLALVERTYNVEVAASGLFLIEDSTSGRVNYYFSSVSSETSYIVDPYTGEIAIDK